MSPEQIYLKYEERRASDLKDGGYLGPVTLHIPVTIEIVDGRWEATTTDGENSWTAGADEKTAALLRLIAARLDINICDDHPTPPPQQAPRST